MRRRRDRPVDRHLLSAGREGEHRGDHRGRPAAHGARRRSTSRTCATKAIEVMEALDETFRIGRELDVAGRRLAPQGAEPAELRPLAGDAGLHPRDDEAASASASTAIPYTAGSTMIRTDRGMLDGARADRLERAASGVRRPRARATSPRSGASTESEAARRLQPGTAIYFLMDEADVQRILAFDETMIGSDGIPVGDKPHPRLWGTFPRVLGHYSRDVGLFPLETAVWKMTGLTARNFGLAGRGSLARRPARRPGGVRRRHGARRRRPTTSRRGRPKASTP